MITAKAFKVPVRMTSADCTLSLGSCRAHPGDFIENLTCDALPFRQCTQVRYGEWKDSHAANKTPHRTHYATGIFLYHSPTSQPTAPHQPRQTPHTPPLP